MVGTRLTYEVEYTDGQKTTSVVDTNQWDCGMEDILDLLKRLLLGAGWDEEQVNTILNIEVEK